MLNLIPAVKTIEEKSGALNFKSVCYDKSAYDYRLLNALEKLPYDENGAKLLISYGDSKSEEYELEINCDSILIRAQGILGAFYAIQTLRQIFTHNEIPCLYIKDMPDFSYRGFYHDVTRGKIPTAETVMKLVDEMAYYKMNSLQLYVEHVFEFEETKDIIETTGYLTKEDIEKISKYCELNFIDFIPSLSTFGHMYDILSQEKYRHLRVVDKPNTAHHFWRNRMSNYTIDPLKDESFELVKSLIDQYYPMFDSKYFNICCDETFDLKAYAEQGYDKGTLYVDFVKKIISHVKSKDRAVMMWADAEIINLPNVVEEIPSDTVFLTWGYSPTPNEANIERISKLGLNQIVCPGTRSWSRFCSQIDVCEPNISRSAEYAKKHGALGILNTNWGDWNNPCSIELAMYGLVLGAEKSWTVETGVDDEFYKKVSHLLFENEKGMECMLEISRLHSHSSWWGLCDNYIRLRYNDGKEFQPSSYEHVLKCQREFTAFIDELKTQSWKNDEYRTEMLISAEGLLVMAELMAKLSGVEFERITDTHRWLEKYSEKWLEKNKPSELFRIQEMFNFFEERASEK